MIVGIGTDIIEINRIEKAISKNNRFLTRIFTQKEIDYFESVKMSSQTIAGAFSAKEAVLKSLGTGLRDMSFQDIEITRNQLGKPSVTLYANALEIAKQQNIGEVLITISHCKEYATAYAIAKEM